MIFCKEDKFLLVKVFKSYLKDFDIYDRRQIINLFKNIFIKIKDKYNLSGLFDVDIYVNDYYGMIIEIDNLSFYEEEIDIKIKVHLDALFLVEINSNEILDYDGVFYYKNKFYGIYNNINDKEVIYKDTYNIIKEGIKII